MGNEKYGRWTVLSKTKIGNHYRCECVCDCGTLKFVNLQNMKSGKSKSCGCYHAEQTIERNKRTKRLHGLSKHPLYSKWKGAKARCYNPKEINYHHYGGRGIDMCQRWLEPKGVGFVNFLEDVEHSHVDGLELDRIDNDKGYSKENCKWSTRSEQCSNRRPFKRGSCLSKQQVKDLTFLKRLKSEIPYSELRNRYSTLGWSMERTISEKLGFSQQWCEVQGVDEKIKLKEFCDMKNIKSYSFGHAKRTKGVECAFNKFLAPQGVTALYGESKGELTLIYKTKEKQND